VAEHNELGRWGEDIAASYLLEKGFVILERDWHSGHRDIDIVAMKDEVIVFVEVKTRRNRMFTDPETAVDWRKMRSLRLSANHYVNYCKTDRDIRFDVVTVVGMPGATPEIQHLEDISI
jgi:putative endonuclease